MVTESDLDLLEMYLDDALPDRELAEAARRIAAEPELAAELQRMRAQREMRCQVFALLEPSEATVDRLLGRIDESIRRRSWFEKQLRWGRWAGAAAACILLGFATGYVGRGPSQPSSPGLAVNPGVINRTSTPAVAGSSGGSARDGITFVGKLPPAAPVAVQITDNTGRVVAVQHFESAEKAREFANDFRTWQERQRQLQSGNVQLLGGKF